MTQEQFYQDQLASIEALKLLVRAREDFQAQRIRMSNRIGLKADKTSQNIDERELRVSDFETFKEIAQGAADMEKTIEKKLKLVLRRFPIYTEWLLGVKGVGTMAAAHIISNIDIHKATTVSKIWQYAGMNPELIPGKIRIQTLNPEEYSPKEGKVVSVGKDYVIVQTDKLIRGDKLKAPFICPFNKRLKSALLGVMADGFIKQQNVYCIEHYNTYKNRLQQSSNITREVLPGGKVKDIMWKDAKKNHIHQAAKRKMVKMFLLDLYVNWRKIEGLSVRPTYQEEYLGHVHS